MKPDWQDGRISEQKERAIFFRVSAGLSIALSTHICYNIFYKCYNIF